MKGIFIFLFVLLAFTSNATVHYISTSGNDATGNGTAGNPWRTLYRATTLVTTAGDVIYVNAGTYLETQQSYLATGVSLEGTGVTSVIQWTGTAQYEAILYLASPEGTNGNQSISYLMFDGRNLATSWAVNIRGRSNVSIHHCSFQNFQDRGVIWGGRNDNGDGPPAIYATGNSFHNNIMNNCATCNGVYGTGCLGIGGQQGMLVYNNTITQNQRAANQNGWPIKYWNEGHLRGVKIYNNTLTTQPIQAGMVNGQNGFWDFAIELFYEQGLEIYNNTMTGSVDINFNSKGAYPFTAWIHDNLIGFTNTPPSNQCGIIMEFDVETAIVENNIIRNCADGIVFSPRANTAVSNTEIRKNLLYNIGSPSGYGRCIGNYTDGNTNWTISNTNIYNNTVVCRTTGAPYDGICINDIATGSVNNVRIRNNIVQGTNGGYITTTDPSRWSNSIISHNNGFGNAFNIPFTDFSGTSALPTSNSISNNLVNINPLFVGGGNYNLQALSPMIDVGINVGMSFSGAAPDKGYSEYNGAAVNIPPTANAGTNISITLPVNTTSLSGTGNDPDGSITAYLWTKISGPAAGTITTPNNQNTTLTALVQGTYLFELRVTDNSGAFGRDTVQVTVNAAVNIPPTANAGTNISITLPVNTTSLAGTGNDPDGSITAYLWTKISGPAAGTITTPNNQNTTLTALVQGTYLFELRVTDNSGAFGRDTVQVTVNAAANIPPTANAGINISITLPVNTTSLAGTGNDPDGSITAYLWTKISGPAAGTITTPNNQNTTLTALVQGTYLFELRVTDNSGAFGRDTVQVTVNAAANIPPTANAGTNISITLPVNTTSLSGTGNDPDGSITAYLWTKISGPAAGTITTPNNQNTTLTALVQGTYLFELRVTDNSGAFGRDTVQVTVNAAVNIPPTANAGTNISITLPVNTTSLAGTGNDPDGSITAYLWTKISGPAAGTITTPNNQNTTLTALVQGTYLFELRVTDNSGAFGRDTVQVTVNAAANIPPTANAGINISITLPVNTTSLAGTGNDPDGSITAYLWTKISGPAAGTITTPNNQNTTLTALVQGTYLFELRVTDNSGAFGRDTVQVTVNAAANIPPTANAGTNISITLPVNTTSLAGTGNDPDGSITAYLWTKISGPAAGTITTPNNQNTTLTALVGGIYRYELTVTDNNGATGKDTVDVIVFVPNIPPVANAGLTQSLTLPTNSTTLTGSGTDVDGTVISYSWLKLNGPAAGTITNSTAAVTTVTGLAAGTYNFVLIVTDNNGGAGRDTVMIIVNPENIPPTANAGTDQTIFLPNHSVQLTGRGTDVDGFITAYRWKQFAGPIDKLTSPNTPVTVLDNLVEGIYGFELTVTDNKGAVDYDTIVVTVKPLTATIPDNSIKVYPNLVRSVTTLEINKDNAGKNMLIVVTDMQGKTVYKKQLTPAATVLKETLDFSSYSSGGYLVTVFFSLNNKQTVKVIKQ